MINSISPAAYLNKRGNRKTSRDSKMKNTKQPDKNTIAKAMAAFEAKQKLNSIPPKTWTISQIKQEPKK